MAIEYESGFDGLHLIATVSGALRLAEVSALHTHLLKSLAEQPDALLLDLSGLTVTEPLALAVFTAANRQAGRWPGVPILLCGPPPATRELLDGHAFRRLDVVDSLDAARARLAGDPAAAVPVLSDELLPISGAARHARDLATDACLRWDLPHLVGPAGLIATELVSNVIDHAHTMMTLRLSLRPRYLHIAVRDGSPDQVGPPVGPAPETGRGRGLIMVDATAHSWGCVPSADGKVVWASLSHQPGQARHLEDARHVGLGAGEG
ncbi:STAS domain-containing protein [Paractinoplanes lichenicola]|uniref:STAS domain-containing protein n=1 Tax=Paractinoplanes lichenicola TaxID=2802976 RepID=A0ABS1VX86_9ACTN|nr:STAS domain-containing protein [Actinoplanes lichenicola]MBL7259101.1 STAS domain-containing protein [Actinoplanes lichenicola]